MIVLIVRSGRPDVQRLAGTVRDGIQGGVNFATSSTASAAPERPAALRQPRISLRLQFSVDRILATTSEASADTHREQHHQREGGVECEYHLPHLRHLVRSVGFLVQHLHVGDDERDH